MYDVVSKHMVFVTACLTVLLLCYGTESSKRSRRSACCTVCGLMPQLTCLSLIIRRINFDFLALQTLHRDPINAL